MLKVYTTGVASAMDFDEDWKAIKGSSPYRAPAIKLHDTVVRGVLWVNVMEGNGDVDMPRIPVTIQDHGDVLELNVQIEDVAANATGIAIWTQRAGGECVCRRPFEHAVQLTPYVTADLSYRITLEPPGIAGFRRVLEIHGVL